jgi:single-strand DNA-binding protein
MADETVITIVGNLTADPELRTIGSGASVVNFTLAATPRTYNRNTKQFEDGQALFMRCSAWRDLADHIARSCSKGMRVIARGRLGQRNYQAQDGSNRSVVELTVEEIGPSLKYAIAIVQRQAKGSGFQGTYGRADDHVNDIQTDNNQTPIPATPQDPWSQAEADNEFSTPEFQ